MARIRPVIMCGGAGARLWPFSRQASPKQLLAVVGQRSMLQETAARVASGDFRRPLIVTGEEHGVIAEGQLAEIGVQPAAILLEPTARNTAAVAALAAEWALAGGEDELLLLLPSDHFVLDSVAFHAAVRMAIATALEGGIVTFGVQPSGANTQYGYIEAKPEPSDASPVLKFVEKPDSKTAARFCRSGRHYWNSGIFLARASTLVEELEAYLPSTREAVARAFGGRSTNGRFIRPDSDWFSTLESISIDCAVMQKTKRAFVVPVDMGWSDVGSWSAVWSSSAKDDHNNVLVGDVLTIDTRNSLVRSDGSAVVVTIGLEDVVVVGTKDAVLVAPMQRSDEVKGVVEQLANAGRPCATKAPKASSDQPRLAPEIAGAHLTTPLHRHPVAVED
jgi:mannose-1-phosphate guanylyltransferase/mannose-6-phosphate isomerase